jgi:hypothetical protein
MNIQKTEIIRLEYRLPAGFGNQFSGWQRDERDQFPEDRAHQNQKNNAEFKAKSVAGLITRRAK